MLENLTMPFAVFALILTLLFSVSGFGQNTRIYPTPSEVRTIFSRPAEVANYVGIEGYLRYADKYFSGNMGAAAELTWREISEPEKRMLNWGAAYDGTTDEYRVEPSRLFDAVGNPRSQFLGPAGYVLYADLQYRGRMTRAYRNVMTVLTDTQWKSLQWGVSYRGTTKDYKEERERFFDQDGKLQYTGKEGLFAYAERWYEGNLTRASLNVSAVLTPAEKEALEWGRVYYGTAEEYQEERTRLFDGLGNAKFIGPQGYMDYAELFYDYDMLMTYRNVHAVLTDSEKQLLNWGNQFHGTVQRYLEERNKLFDASGKPRHVGTEGYIEFSEINYKGAMHTAYVNASAVLTPQEKQSLAWGNDFHGSTKQFREERQLLFGADRTPQFIGPEGYVEYADLKYEGNMHKTFTNVSAVLTPAEKLQMQWGSVFTGSTMEYREYRAFLFADGMEGAIEKWFGKLTGLSRLVDAYAFHLGQVQPFAPKSLAKIRNNFRAVANPHEVHTLGWDSVNTPKPILPIQRSSKGSLRCAQVFGQ